jgi:hypothetical protein
MSKDRYCPAADKKKYHSYAQALAKLDSHYDQVTGLSTLSGSVYSCDFCGGFHVSSKKFTLHKPTAALAPALGLVERVA